LITVSFKKFVCLRCQISNKLNRYLFWVLTWQLCIFVLEGRSRRSSQTSLTFIKVNINGSCNCYESVVEKPSSRTFGHLQTSKGKVSKLRIENCTFEVSGLMQFVNVANGKSTSSARGNVVKCPPFFLRTLENCFYYPSKSFLIKRLLCY
jgi:hypothetical protein